VAITAKGVPNGQRELLFVIDPPEHLKPAKDSSIAMMRELARRGQAIWVCTPPDLTWDKGTVRGRVAPITVRPMDAAVDPPVGKHAKWYAPAGPSTLRDLAEFTAVLMRKDPPFDAEYLYATHLLGAAARCGARVFNDPAALRNHNEKLAITEFTDFIAPTLVSGDATEILAFLHDQGEIVVKPLDGMGGSGIFRLSPGDPNTNVILEAVTQDGSRTVMAQRFLPAIAQGDKRILLIGGQPVPFALARVPKAGESRGNLAAGGTGYARALTDRDRQIAETLGPTLNERGLLLVGLDVIGDHLTEINVTSPTCFVEITQQSGFDVAAAFVDALEARVGA
jgi:glutathione synthase